MDLAKPYPIDLTEPCRRGWTTSGQVWVEVFTLSSGAELHLPDVLCWSRRVRRTAGGGPAKVFSLQAYREQTRLARQCRSLRMRLEEVRLESRMLRRNSQALREYAARLAIPLHQLGR